MQIEKWTNDTGSQLTKKNETKDTTRSQPLRQPTDRGPAAQGGAERPLLLGRAVLHPPEGGLLARYRLGKLLVPSSVSYLNRQCYVCFRWARSYSTSLPPTKCRQAEPSTLLTRARQGCCTVADHTPCTMPCPPQTCGW